jgi:hypothetical protein
VLVETKKHTKYNVVYKPFFTITTLYIKHPTYRTVLQRRPNYKKAHRPDEQRNSGDDEGELVCGGP